MRHALETRTILDRLSSAAAATPAAGGMELSQLEKRIRDVTSEARNANNAKALTIAQKAQQHCDLHRSLLGEGKSDQARKEEIIAEKFAGMAESMLAPEKNR
jgi:hypothetical protein